MKRIEKHAKGTGGFFSCSYLVQSDRGPRAFLKALDFTKALQAPDPALAFQGMTEAYNFERELLLKCNQRHMDRVVKAITDGLVRIDGAPAGGVVQYLIFELADHDVRAELALLPDLELAWVLRVLHHIATGLHQLHSADIAHQDLKPSNVLVFRREKVSKVADLGSASYRGHDGPKDHIPFPGDYSYGPPELLYRHVDPDWNKRRLGCDAYLLGSMVVFFFTELSATSVLMSEMHADHHWLNWRGSFDEVLPYIRDAFSRVLATFAESISNTTLRSELTQVVEQLCEPHPRYRGHPANIRGLGSQFSLERYVSKFDLLATRAELRMFKD